MFKSYFKVALRSFRRNKLVTFINVFGLGLAMTIGMMVLIRMDFELGFDAFHPQRAKIYRITTAFAKKTGEKWNMASTSLPLHSYIENHCQDVKKVTAVYPAINENATGGGKELYLRAVFTNPAFFEIFAFEFKTGSPQKALSQAQSIVLSAALAKKFFGAADPLGKEIVLESGEQLVVTGVLNEPEGKSQLQYDAYVSAATIPVMENNKTLPSKWADWFSFNSGYTFVLMPESGDQSVLQRELNLLSDDLNERNTEGRVSFGIQPLSKINPSWDFLSNEMPGVSPWAKIITEIAVALLILAAACFNYTNLTIARALTRAKEVGVRKINGAARVDVFVQYVIEAVVLSVLALGFAWLVLSFIIRFAPFNDGYEFIPSTFQYNTLFFLETFLFAIGAGLLAGLAPAWLLSSFKPLRVLTNLSTARIGGKINLQKALIVFQYSLSLVMVIFLLTFYRQFSFMGAADPGYRKENIVVVPLSGINDRLAKQKIAEIAGIKAIGAMSGELSKRFNGLTAVVWIKEPQESIKLNYYYADADFIREMKFKFIAGENFPPVARDDNHDIILNEEAARSLGFKDASAAIGQNLWLNDSTRWKITAVVNNFSYENLGIPVRPMAFRTAANAYNFLYAVTDAKVDRVRVPKYIAAALQSLSSGYRLVPTWFEEDLQRSYSQAATISLLGYLAFMATAIASLGLLGLVIHHTQTRRKEISIRKIVGATERQLVGLLSFRFIKLLLVAGLVAVPLGYILSHLFLRNFVVRIQETVVGPLLCFLFLLAIGLVTIISQTYRAAVANPGRDLRTE